eukprot:1183477-Prorocentrum_minimum.AAC.1
MLNVIRVRGRVSGASSAPLPLLAQEDPWSLWEDRSTHAHGARRPSYLCSLPDQSQPLDKNIPRRRTSHGPSIGTYLEVAGEERLWGASDGGERFAVFLEEHRTRQRRRQRRHRQLYMNKRTGTPPVSRRSRRPIFSLPFCDWCLLRRCRRPRAQGTPTKSGVGVQPARDENVAADTIANDDGEIQVSRQRCSVCRGGAVWSSEDALWASAPTTDRESILYST